MRLHRRALLAGTAASLCLTAAPATLRAATIQGSMPWRPGAGDPPKPIRPGPWEFFTPEEGSAVEALVDRLIPPDDKWAGAKDAGCAIYIDRQLAGPYGRSEGLYMRPPFMDGLPTQGEQGPLTPAMRYRRSLAALAAHVKAAYAGKQVHELPPATLDELLRGLENGSVQLGDASGKAFFEVLLRNTQEGFFADPLYGGNKDMVGWRMIGFPGARYDQRDWVLKHNQPYPLPPVSIYGRAEWNGTKKG
jgi:gluconate 2-dehydrogenase gamma chain